MMTTAKPRNNQPSTNTTRMPEKMRIGVGMNTTKIKILVNIEIYTYSSRIHILHTQIKLVMLDMFYLQIYIYLCIYLMTSHCGKRINLG